MSGGFFRGTSADQDTRFSNKQAKLLKSQKFAAELENLVDMTKVKMDVMRPWIAKRVTELIGFEDEVLINFIYSLLEGKAVNGKQVQISLTGFMERNTGKFMKELWALLLSAQQNVSGVPQQFLDAKEEETKTKKAETERIATEIQKKKEKEKQEFEEEKMKMDGDGEKSSDKCNELAPNMKLEAGEEAADEKERYKRNGRRRSSRGSQSPGSSYHSPSLRGRRRSRSISRTQSSKSSSISLERRDRSSQRRSVTPRRHIARRSPSPWRRSYHLRRRSSSHSRRRSPSPTRYRVRSPRHRISRSPMHRRSRSPVRRRSRSPIWRSPRGYRSRTPTKRRSQYTMQGRSPSPRGRSPSPVRRRLPSPAHRPSPSPARHHSRSPVRRYSRSPARLRSRSPLRRHSRSPLRRHSRSPLRRYSTSPRRQSPSPARRQHRRSPSSSLSPVRRTSSMHGHHGRRRSFIPGGERSSPQEPGSPSPASRNSVSPVMRGSLKNARSPIKSPGERNRSHEKYSPARRASPRERAEPAGESRKRTNSVELRPVVSLRSPQRDIVDRSESHGKRYLSPSIEKSPYGPDASIGGSDSEERRFVSRRRNSHKRSPLRKAVQPEARHDSSGTSMGDGSHFSNREIGVHRDRSSGKISPMPPRHKDSRSTVEIRGLTDGAKTRKSQLSNSDRPHDTLDNKEYRGRQDLSTSKTTALSVKNREPYDGARTKDEKIDQAADVKGGHQIPEVEGLQKLSRKSEQNDHNVSLGKENDERRDKTKEKRKHKKSERHDDSDDYSSSDSYEERKEAKRRRREEKKLKKEDRRRRREEKRRKKDERRAEKNKLKSGDAGSLSPDLARLHSEDEGSKRRVSRASNIEEKESEQKKLEIELREKALESLRAKKGF